VTINRGHAILLGVLVVAACSGPPAGSAPPPEVVTLGGRVAIPIAGIDLASPPSSIPPSCTGSGALADIHEGTEIVVRDGAGTILETGALGPGEVVAANEGLSCWFGFHVPDVPLGANFYTVQVADRAVRIYSADELEASDWDIVIAPVGEN
jgi:hypothetical protein